MKEHKVNNLNNFIAGWYFDDLSLCDDIISHFNKNPNKSKGLFLTKSGKVHNPKKKESVDLSLEDPKLLSRYVNELQKVVAEYKKMYIYSDQQTEIWGLKSKPNIQYYKPPSGGYHEWHTERAGQPYTMDRHLVYMTYLNDVTDGGETEWYYQKLKINPEKGLTVIWPVDWMFTHRGIFSPTQEKYIATGWFHFRT